jgi:hypothetical protein
MRRWCPLMLVLVIALGTVASAASTIAVRPPNSTGYGPAALSSLQATMTKLGKVLGDYDLGCDRYFTADAWSSRDFAAYTAGTLGRLGYGSRLVEQTGWPDGTHVWVLVGIPVDQETAWIPVEACPAAGRCQRILGTIPASTDSNGVLWFDPRYTRFDGELTLPPNKPPVAEIRAVPGSSVPGEEVTFLGVTSYDPDGEIVRYYWDFAGVGTSEERTASAAFPSIGVHKVVLTVTDNRGTTATTHLDFIVQKAAKPSAPPAASGCPCQG